MLELRISKYEAARLPWPTVSNLSLRLLETVVPISTKPELSIRIRSDELYPNVSAVALLVAFTNGLPDALVIVRIGEPPDPPVLLIPTPPFTVRS